MGAAFLGFASIVVGLASASPEVGEEWVSAYLTGVVRDEQGQPVPGVLVWWRDQYGVIPPKPDACGGMSLGRGTTDASGRFRMEFLAPPGKPVVGLRVSANAPEFVRSEVDFRSDKPVTRGGDAGVLDIRLARGDVIVKVPLRLWERLNGETPERRQFFVRVRRPGFVQDHMTEPGGGFEFWVPEGRFTLERPRAADDYVDAIEGVAGGTRGVELVKKEDPIAPDVLARAYDALCDDMGRNYSHFELKRIDPEALRRKYRPRSVGSGSLPAFVDVLGEMLGELDDGHVWFTDPADAVVAYPRRERSGNLNVEATEATLEGVAMIGEDFARVGTTRPDGFGVVRIVRQGRADEEAVDRVVAFIQAHTDAPGFLVDLRTAGGGDELLARRIAREFASRDAVYAESKYRDGPRPTDFGPIYDRVLEASERPFAGPVVCVLGPGCVSSGEGFAKMLKCLPRVTTVGMPTRGSSGNPKPFTLPGVPVTVMYSRWVDMLPDGTPIEGRGIPPEILVDRPWASYQEADPTWERAVEVLREKVKAARP